MNCVTSSSPRKGITHYPSLAQHPIPSPSFTRHPRLSMLCLHPRFDIEISHKWSFKASTNYAAMPSRHVSPSQRKFPLDFMWLDGPSCWRSFIYLLSCRWWNTRDYKKVLTSTNSCVTFVHGNETYIFWLSFACSLHFGASASGLLFLPFHPVLEWLWITQRNSPRNIRNIMSLLLYNNINNLRAYPKPVFLPCRSRRRHFPAGVSQTRSSVYPQSTKFLFQLSLLYYQSARTFITVYPHNDFP